MSFSRLRAEDSRRSASRAPMRSSRCTWARVRGSPVVPKRSSMTLRSFSGRRWSASETRLGDDRLVHFLLGRRGLAGLQVAEGRRVVVVAQAHVEARGGAVDGDDGLDLLHGHLDRGRDLVGLGLALELHRELIAGAADLARLGGDVGGQPDRAAGVVQAALDGLPDPQRRVGREAEALAPVELLGGANEAQHSLLHEVVEGQTMALIATGDRDHQSQIAVDEPLLGDEVATLDALRQLELLRRAQETELVGALQKLIESVGVNERLVSEGVLRFEQDPPSGVNPITTVGILP